MLNFPLAGLVCRGSKPTWIYRVCESGSGQWYCFVNISLWHHDHKKQCEELEREVTSLEALPGLHVTANYCISPLPLSPPFSFPLFLPPFSPCLSPFPSSFLPSPLPPFLPPFSSFFFPLFPFLSSSLLSSLPPFLPSPLPLFLFPLFSFLPSSLPHPPLLLFPTPLLFPFSSFPLFSFPLPPFPPSPCSFSHFPLSPWSFLTFPFPTFPFPLFPLLPLSASLTFTLHLFPPLTSCTHPVPLLYFTTLLSNLGLIMYWKWLMTQLYGNTTVCIFAL